MRRGSALLLGIPLLLTLILPASADEREDVERRLRDIYKGKVVTLRDFYSGDRLQFSSDGTLLKGGAAGPWTLFGLIEVKELKIARTRLTLEGHRLFVTFEEDKSRKYHRAPKRIRIDIDYRAGQDLENHIQDSLTKVFLAHGESLATVAPRYWRRFLGGEEANAHEKRDEGPGPAPTGAAGYPSETQENITVRAGVEEARLLKRVSPQYPDIAKSAHVEGIVSLEATIGTDGHLRDLQIVRARGMGLEEASIEAVRQWVYEPTLLNGEPVEVVTYINVVYKLR